MSKHNYSKQKQIKTRHTLTDRPPKSPSLGKENNNISFQKVKSNEVCQNHKQRIATFSIQTQGLELVYCQKCAIRLASQGFTVKSMDDNILDKSQHLLNQLIKRKQQLKLQIIKAKEYYSCISDNLNIYFEQIIGFIKQKKQQFDQFIQIQQDSLISCRLLSINRIQSIVYQYQNIFNKKGMNTRIKQISSIIQSFNNRQPLQFKDIVIIDINEIKEMLQNNLKIRVNTLEQQNNFKRQQQRVIEKTKRKYKNLTESNYSLDQLQT